MEDQSALLQQLDDPAFVRALDDRRWTLSHGCQLYGPSTDRQKRWIYAGDQPAEHRKRRQQGGDEWVYRFVGLPALGLNVTGRRQSFPPALTRSVANFLGHLPLVELINAATADSILAASDGSVPPQFLDRSEVSALAADWSKPFELLFQIPARVLVCRTLAGVLRLDREIDTNERLVRRCGHTAKQTLLNI